MRVRFTEFALSDLEAIAAYIVESSPGAAGHVINEIERVCRKLGELPGMGRISEVPPARKLTVPPWRYKIIYQMDEEAGEVIILRVYHGARDLPY